MPELPEVELFRRVARKCVGRTVGRAVVDDPGMLEGVSAASFARRLKSARLGPVTRHGKLLLIAFDEAGCLAMHFGTNGSLRLLAADEEEPRYVRIALVFTEGGRLAYLNPRRIGSVALAKDARSLIAAEGLGPDALDRRFDRKALEAILKRQRDVKSILMDQALVVGIGNLYSDEILFQARIHPQTRGEALAPAQVARLFAATKHVLKSAIAAGAGSEQALDRLPRNFLLRERRKGGHCPHCGGAVATLKSGGRTSYYCPRCQKRA
jgi:formamidopyrimidine-DNA glycosylase